MQQGRCGLQALGEEAEGTERSLAQALGAQGWRNGGERGREANHLPVREDRWAAWGSDSVRPTSSEAVGFTLIGLECLPRQ